MYNVIDALTDVIKDQDDEIRGLNKLVAGRATIHNNEYAVALKIFHSWIADNTPGKPMFGAWVKERLNSQK